MADEIKGVEGLLLKVKSKVRVGGRHMSALFCFSPLCCIICTYIVCVRNQHFIGIYIYGMNGFYRFELRVFMLYSACTLYIHNYIQLYAFLCVYLYIGLPSCGMGRGMDKSRDG